MKAKWLLWTTALFAVDQIAKSCVEHKLELNEERKLTERIVLRRVHNEGLSLGLLSDTPEAVKMLSSIAAGSVTVSQFASMFQKKGFWKKACLSTLAAGAWSNTVDRFMRGYVVDYIGFKCKDKQLAAVTYNLADFFIAAGAAGVPFGMIFGGKTRKPE